MEKVYEMLTFILYKKLKNSPLFLPSTPPWMIKGTLSHSFKPTLCLKLFSGHKKLKKSLKN